MPNICSCFKQYIFINNILKHGKKKSKKCARSLFQQRNFKQKIVSLLKRFKVPDELEGSVARRAGGLRGERELDALFQELESLSCGEGDDSGPDIDSISVGSTPKPSLRPFFSNSRCNLPDNILGKCDALFFSVI